MRCSESGARGDGGAGYIEGEKGGGPSSVYPGRGHRPPTGRGGRNDLRWVWEAWLVLFEVSGSGFWGSVRLREEGVGVEGWEGCGVG